MFFDLTNLLLIFAAMFGSICNAPQPADTGSAATSLAGGAVDYYDIEFGRDSEVCIGVNTTEGEPLKVTILDSNLAVMAEGLTSGSLCDMSCLQGYSGLLYVVISNPNSESVAYSLETTGNVLAGPKSTFCDRTVVECDCQGIYEASSSLE